MKRELLSTPAFERSAKRITKKQRELNDAIRAALELLAEDAFDPRLKMHKLKGALNDCWAASAAYDLRIVFQFAVHHNAEAVRLLGVGTHDEVY